jgi:hypothetical protein
MLPPRACGASVKRSGPWRLPIGSWTRGPSKLPLSGGGEMKRYRCVDCGQIHEWHQRL